ncbi:MAG: phosphonate C-P lyase system protein PhnH [Erysipelotrichaceae bacterium]|nr:phosphonate C-P lyase system protein PhnH [Erysipelotrichaceae bacterium]
MKTKHEFDEVFDGQKVYRKLLEALSNPGRKVSLKDEASKFDNTSVRLAMAMTLLDNEVTFYTDGNEALRNEVELLTNAKHAALSSADFIFVKNEYELEEAFNSAKTGTLEDPQKSATLIISCEGLNNEKTYLKGPGIKDVQEFDLPSIVKKAVKRYTSLNIEYPMGMDMFFITDNYEVIGIPRLIRTEDR